MFWILLWFTAFPERRFIQRITVGCVLFTCFLEVMQLWRYEPLVKFRATPIGAALLGSTFAWGDIPPYFIGGVVGFAVLYLYVWIRPETHTAENSPVPSR